MPNRQKAQPPLSPELDAIAAAADRLRAYAGDDPSSVTQSVHLVADAVSAAIQAGAALSAIAEAERMGRSAPAPSLRADILRKVECAAKRKRETDRDTPSAADRTRIRRSR